MTDDEKTVAQCCDSIEQLFMRIFKESKKKFPDQNVMNFCARISEANPNIFNIIMSNAMLAMLFSTLKHSTKLFSGAFFALYLCFRSEFPKIKEKVIENFNTKRTEMLEAFADLEAVDLSCISTKTQFSFKRRLKAIRQIAKEVTKQY